MLRGTFLTNVLPHGERRRLKDAGFVANSGVVVAIVFAGLIFLAILIAVFCRKYDGIKKYFRKKTKMKKKRDINDYKATEIVVKTLEKPFPIVVASDGDSATASVVTAAANETVAIPGATDYPGDGHNDSLDLSESSWTTLGNTASVGIEPKATDEKIVIPQRSPRWEMKVVPLNHHSS